MASDKCVVRNEQYKRGQFSDVERHNERENSCYGNGDVVLDRSHLNIHFKKCEGGYEETFEKMLTDGVISDWGLKKEPTVFDEFIFDVNTDYFDRNGGYEYAQEFFAEAYRMAVKEAGGEEYILSAVMHADERNKALSERLGRDVYHYHLHVVYIPVVDKELRFKKNNKDPELAGKVKAVIKQISHSKKWASVKVLDENGEVKRNEGGKAILRYSYSLLQDRFFEHMRAAGFTGFERGEHGSTVEHLSVLDYKIQQDKKAVAALGEQADALGEAIQDKESAAAMLDKKVEKRQERLSALDEKLTVKKEDAASFAEIEGMAKKTVGGNFQLTPDNWKHVSGLAKEGVKSRGVIKGLKERINALLGEIAGLKSRLERYGEGQGITDTMRYYQAQQRAPRRMADAIAEILRQPPEQTQAPRREHKRDSRGVDI